MRTLLGSAFLILVLEACASGGASQPNDSVARPDQTVRVMGTSGTGTIGVAASNPTTAQTLPYSPDAVWRALPEAFAAFGIPVTDLDAAHRTISNGGFTTRRRLKDVPLSRYVDCGRGSGGSNADDYDVRMSFTVTVSAADARTSKVTATLEAAARPASYSQDYSQCTSLGALEGRLFAFLDAKLAR